MDSEKNLSATEQVEDADIRNKIAQAGVAILGLLMWSIVAINTLFDGEWSFIQPSLSTIGQLVCGLLVVVAATVWFGKSEEPGK